jgi:prepilin-type N-terminal cleavage/methylation domain-containing protein
MNARDRAFTLVEMMVVIGVIGILAAMAFPLYAKVRQSAVRGTVKNDAAEVAGAAQRYCMDKGVTVVPITVIIASGSAGYVQQLSKGNTINVLNMYVDSTFTFEIGNPLLSDGGLTFDAEGHVVADPY